MGMFDTLRCDYPLPHHQEADFQTKYLAHLVHGELGLGGLLDDYRITADGRLMLHKHIREWCDDPEAFLGGYSESARDWWEELADVCSETLIYACQGLDAGEQILPPSLVGQQGHETVLIPCSAQYRRCLAWTRCRVRDQSRRPACRVIPPAPRETAGRRR